MEASHVLPTGRSQHEKPGVARLLCRSTELQLSYATVNETLTGFLQVRGEL
jgi:hypothetical protein